MNSSTLVIHAQTCWHQEAYIIGNTEGLIELRDALDKAISEGESSINTMNVDGEGYIIMMGRKEDAEMDNLNCGYTDKTLYNPQSVEIKHPSQLLNYRELYESAMEELEEKYKDINEND